MQRPSIRTVLATATTTATVMALGLVNASVATAHGYTDNPTSRQLHCADGTVDNCGAIQWEPQSVEGPDGFPEAGPADGQICAGGNPEFAPLDNPRSGNWPTDELAAGTNHTFRWTFTAPHSTSKFEYFVTNNTYDPLEPLTRDMLEPEPFATVPFEGQPPYEYSHTAQLPAGKQGQHLILAVWTVADTANAFYACSDVYFTGDGGPGDPPDDPPPPDCEFPAWDPDTVYWGGDTVNHDGTEYRARWWTLDDEPGTGGQWGVWEDLGTCSTTPTG